MKQHTERAQSRIYFFKEKKWS